MNMAYPVRRPPHASSPAGAIPSLCRAGIVGRDPADGTRLREGDVLVVYGSPEALEHAQALLLAG